MKVASKRQKKDTLGFFPHWFRENPLQVLGIIAYFATEKQVTQYKL
jgi:hypothetical protein